MSVDRLILSRPWPHQPRPNDLPTGRRPRRERPSDDLAEPQVPARLPLQNLVKNELYQAP